METVSKSRRAAGGKVEAQTSTEAAYVGSSLLPFLSHQCCKKQSKVLRLCCSTLQCTRLGTPKADCFTLSELLYNEPQGSVLLLQRSSSRHEPHARQKFGSHKLFTHITLNIKTDISEQLGR